eukprot:5114181-Prymnesium_polylepis.1
MKKAMAADTLICIACRATALGPIAACQCPGGRTKPAADYDDKVELLAAAMERQKLGTKSKMAAGAAQQGSVQAAKAKSKADKTHDAADLDLSTQDLVDVAFEAGKLGMSIEKNCVSGVAEDGAAAALKVKPGWVIRKVNGDDAPANRNAVLKMATAAMKAGQLRITFQTPLEDGIQHCTACDKFVPDGDFDGATVGLDAGPGKQVCAGCEEFGDMFG